MLHSWERSAYRVFVGKRKEKKPLKKTTSKWEDNIKMDLTEIG
jgi:hypothetical protein